MKKVLIIVVAVILMVSIGFGMFYFALNKNGNSRVTNDKAEKDKEHRYLTVINGTNEIINEVHITVGEGTEIEHTYQENPDEDSFSIKISEEYDEYDMFTVSLIDRYGLKYQREVSNVKEKGRTEVKITQDDYIKQNGDWKRKMDKFFNEE